MTLHGKVEADLMTHRGTGREVLYVARSWSWPVGSTALSMARSCSLVAHAQEKNDGLRREKAIKNKTFIKGRNLH